MPETTEPQPSQNKPPNAGRDSGPSSGQSSANPAATAKSANPTPKSTTPPSKPAARAKPASASASAARAKPAAAAGAKGAEGGPVEMLKADHRKVEALFAQYEKAEESRKTELARQICAELVIHTMLEEEIFYPECRRRAQQDEEVQETLKEAQVEHDSAKLLIADLFAGAQNDPFRDAKVQVLGEQIRHHVREEEKPGDGVLAKAVEEGLDTPELARRLQQRKQALLAEQQSGRLRPGAPLSLRTQGRSNQSRTDQEDNMPRERDERGRFMDEDDRDYGRSYAARGGGGRSRYDEDDDRGRGRGGWFGDPEGHSRASREGWDERRGDDRGYRSRGRDDDDDRGRSRDRGHGGWFGDPEGHSRASREGWDERRGEDRSYRSRGRDDDDDRGRSQGRGQGGWFGDPEGHARAAREGWDERRDDRGYRSRDRDDDDDRGRSRGRDHGGWYGDREGHSQASRRGWEDRR